MVNLSQAGYSNDEVIELLTAPNRIIDFEYELLDRDESYLGMVTVTAGKIDFDSTASIMGAGAFSIKELTDINYIDERIKPYFKIKAPNGWLRYPLGVFLIESPNRKSDGRRITRSCQAYDKSIILREDRFETRYRITAGSKYTQAVANILGDIGLTNSRIIHSDLAVVTDIEFAAGTTKLDAINQLLTAINYNPIHFDNSGHPVIDPYVVAEERTPEYSYLTNERSIVFPGAEEDLDVFGCANVITRYLTTPEREVLTATYINDSVNSLLSTVNRGRRIVDVKAVTDIADQATLNAYVRREALEQTLYKTVTFDTALMPMHGYLECLSLSNKELGINGKYIETKYSMELEVGGRMSHTCRKAVVL